MAEYKGKLIPLAKNRGGYEVNYSTTEHEIGTWINGSVLYEKTINFGSLPNATVKNVAHEITNLSSVVEIIGYIRQSSNYYPLPLGTYTANNNPQVSVNATNVSIATNADWSTGSAYVTIRYTKSS